MIIIYNAAENRYEKMIYTRCGSSGLKLPAISLGLWHNFGGVDNLENMKAMVFKAFDLGITHFDIANNYGPPPGSAEDNFGRLLKGDLKPYRDELIISSKAGYRMQPGPYGDGGSRKYILSSLDASLKRMGLDYVDIFYHHRPDAETPIEESMSALAQAVRSGKALYAGISNYRADQAETAIKFLRGFGTPCVIHQPSYSMLNRWVEGGLLDVLKTEGVGSIAFCPLAQGLLTNRYLKGIPENSRAAKPTGFLKNEAITDELLGKIAKLNIIAENRGQSLAQMSLAWVLRGGNITSVLIGASKVQQIEENVGTLDNLYFSDEELELIDGVLE